MTALPDGSMPGGASVSLLEVSSAEFGDCAIDRLPELRGDLWLSRDWGETCGAIARLRYVGEMIDQGAVLADHWLVELSAYWRPAAKIMTGVRVDNLLGARYLDRAGGIYGTGRVVLESVQGSWD